MKYMIIMCLTIICLASLSTLLYPGPIPAKITNQDKPTHGTWDFKPTQTWTINEIGGEVLADVGPIISNDEETLFILDWKRNKIYIVDKKGKMVSAFGKQGEGPGEIKQLSDCFFVEGQLIFPDQSRIHYFNMDGSYITSAVISDQIDVRDMIDANQIISAPWMSWRDPNKKGKCLIYNIKEKKETLLFEFSPFKKGVVRKTSGSNTSMFSFSSSSLTPSLVLTYHGDKGKGTGKIYYGMNDEYVIRVRGIKPGEVDSLVFSLEREKKKVPSGYKDKLMEKIDWPANVKNEIKNGFPDEFTSFEDIRVADDGKIYIFVTDPDVKHRRLLDIFSPTGQYLYQAEFTVAKDEELKRVYWHKDKLYQVIEDEEGELTLTKYQFRQPE